MKIMKKNGNVVVYDDEKIVRSILKANDEIPRETVSGSTARSIVNTVINALAEDNAIITTEDIRKGLYEEMVKRGYHKTAEAYRDYKK